MNILVTGAAGFIGASLAEALVARGHRVIGIDNLNPYYAVSLKRDRLARVAATAGEAFRFIECDFGDHEALARALEPLPFELTWLDERDSTPADQAALVEQAESGPAGALHYVMTHDHSLDLDIVSALLRRSEAEVPFIGMIGSHTKIARFRSQLRGRGFSDETQARLITPIGISGIRGKEPAVIAAAVAAEALLLRSRLSA